MNTCVVQTLTDIPNTNLQCASLHGFLWSQHKDAIVVVEKNKNLVGDIVIYCPAGTWVSNEICPSIQGLNHTHEGRIGTVIQTGFVLPLSSLEGLDLSLTHISWHH